MINKTFTATITKEEKSGWICVVWPESVSVLGTGRSARVSGTIDGHDFEVTLMPFGNGSHMVPLKAAIRALLGKEEGDSVEVHINDRINA